MEHKYRNGSESNVPDRRSDSTQRGGINASASTWGSSSSGDRGSNSACSEFLSEVRKDVLVTLTAAQGRGTKPRFQGPCEPEWKGWINAERGGRKQRCGQQRVGTGREETQADSWASWKARFCLPPHRQTSRSVLAAWKGPVQDSPALLFLHLSAGLGASEQGQPLGPAACLCAAHELRVVLATFLVVVKKSKGG